MNKTITYVIILTALALFDCSEKHQEESKKHLPKVIVANGYHVNQQSIKPPTVVEVKDVKSTIAGPPVVIEVKSGFSKIKDFTIVTIGDPDSICVPGQAPHKLPETFPAAGEQVNVKLPDVVIANPPDIVEFNNISYNSYNSRQGLKSNTVASLYNDSKGNIWIGTWTGGVDKFNGQTFSNYSNLQGFISINITQIMEDNNGNMWFGTNNGLNKFDGKTITSFPTIPGLNTYVQKIIKDKEGNVWFSVLSEIYKYDGETFYRFSYEQGLLFQNHTDMIEDKSGNIWIQTANGFCKYDGKSFAHYINPEITWNELKAVLHNDDLSTNTSFKIAKNNYSNLISNGTVTNEDLFFYENGKGLYKYENGAITHLGLENSLNNAELIVREDNTGQLWIASNVGGIAKSNGYIFSHITTKEGLSNQNIKSINSDSQGNIWIGTWEGGLNIYDGTSISIYSTEQGLTSNTIHAIFNDKKENIWLGTWGNGVDYFDGSTFTNYSVNDGLIGNDIHEIMEDSKGNIWFATLNGASKFNGKTFTSYRKEQGLSANEISCILEDSKQNIWFGSRTNGITKFDGESFVQYTTASGLSDNAIYSLMEDNSGNIWIGTYNRGVNKFDGHTFSHFTMDQGLPNNCVWAILQDKNGYIWFGTPNGLCRMNNFQDNNSFRNLKNESDHQASVFKNYFVSDGFLGIGTFHNCLTQDKNGTIWIGANDRISTYHPKWDKTDTIPPFVQLTGISLFNERINWLELEEKQDTILVLNDGTTFKNFEFTEVSNWNYIPEQLKLRHNNNFITFEFVGITSNKPDHVKYQYFLEGFDKNWSPLMNVSNATYTSLPHGKYTFKIKAANSDGFWSDNYTYSFLIKPPAWHTWWAYVFYILVFFTGVWMAHLYMKKRTIQKERQKAQIRELEQAREIEKAYQKLEVAHENLKSTQAQLIQSEKMASLGELTAGIAHEIQNPLNFVNNFSEVSNELLYEMNEEMDRGDIAEAKAISADIRQNLEKINHHGKRADAIVKGMLQHSRTSNGIKEPTNINDLADEYLRLSYHGLRAKDKSFNAVLKTELDPTLPKINVIPQDIGRVLLNLINNAFYAVQVETQRTASLQQSPPIQPNYKPMVMVSTKNMENHVEIRVKDNGPGISSKIKDKIFQPFFTTKPTGQGTGLGLSLSYDIVKAHGGELKVETKKGEGSTFIIHLPKAN